MCVPANISRSSDSLSRTQDKGKGFVNNVLLRSSFKRWPMTLFVLTSANERFPRTRIKISNPASSLRGTAIEWIRGNDLNNEDGDYQQLYLFRSDNKRRPRNPYIHPYLKLRDCEVYDSIILQISFYVIKYVIEILWTLTHWKSKISKWLKISNKFTTLN